jgi:beta-galactosidase GanA
MIALAGGVQSICFWNHRPDIFWREMHGFGLCEWDGTPTDRAREAGRIGQAVNRHPDLFRWGRSPQAQVAIVVNEDLYHFAEATPEALKHLQHTLKGWYQCLWEEGIWVDFIEASQVLQGHLEPYKVAILPFPIAMGDKLAEASREYVSAGGTLISEACPGRVDKYGIANLPGMAKAMRECFGAEHESLSLCQEQVLPTLLEGTGPYQGHAVRASLYVETYRPARGTSILSCDRGVAGVMNTYGQGKGILLGTLTGHAVATYNHTQSRDFMLKLLTDAGVRPERCGRLLNRRRVSEKKEAWFLINDSDRPITESVDVTGFAQVEDLLEGKPLSIKRDMTTINVDSFSIRCLVLSK